MHLSSILRTERTGVGLGGKEQGSARTKMVLGRTGRTCILCLFLHCFNCFVQFRAPGKLCGIATCLDIPTLRPAVKELVYYEETPKWRKRGLKLTGRNNLRVDLVASLCRAWVQNTGSYTKKNSQNSACKQAFMVQL